MFKEINLSGHLDKEEKWTGQSNRESMKRALPNANTHWHMSALNITAKVSKRSLYKCLVDFRLNIKICIKLLLIKRRTFLRTDKINQSASPGKWSK